MPSTAHGELQRDLGAVVGAGEVRAQPGGIAGVTGQTAVERERQRIEDRGLADAGRPLEEEQPPRTEPVEVDDLLVGERADGVHAQGVQSHQADASTRWAASTTSASTARCTGLGGPPGDRRHELRADLDRVAGLGHPGEAQAARHRAPGRTRGPACAASGLAAAPSDWPRGPDRSGRP